MSGLYFVWIYKRSKTQMHMVQAERCKHLNWTWHWDWKYEIFLRTGGGIKWVTASIKLRDLLITWSPGKCKTLYMAESRLAVGGPHLQSYVTFWLRGHVKNSKNLYLHFCNTYGHQTWQQFVIFKPLSYCFKKTIGFDVKASFAGRPLSHLIRWCNKKILRNSWIESYKFAGC